MSDFIFVAKCFLYTLLIAFLLQFKVGGQTLEAHADFFLKNSKISHYAQDAAVGGAMALRDGFYSAKNFILDSTQSFRSDSSRSSR